MLPELATKGHRSLLTLFEEVTINVDFRKLVFLAYNTAPDVPMFIFSCVGFPNDTLVISGGLYDESRVYNPNMTVEEDDELHVEYPAFTSKYSQFKLEFLPEEREVTNQGSSFATFQPET